MAQKQWPWPGDSPIVRTRKIALHYRQLAEEQQQRANNLQKLLSTVDLRTLRLMDPDLGEAVEEMLKVIGATSDNPVEVADRKFIEWGEDWHTPLEAEYGDDEWVPTKVAAKLLHVSEGTVTTQRLNGRIKGKWNKDPGRTNGWYFLVSDLYRLQSELRGRDWRRREKVVRVTDESSRPE